jgi:hypothetical protein
MKRLALVLLMVAGLAAPAMAGPMNILTSTYQSGNGGEFTYKAVGGWIDLSNYAATTKNINESGSFQTFCVETNEYISIPGSYTATLSYDAINGGVGGGSPDPVSQGTAWLYSQFAAGTLQNYYYNAGSGSTFGSRTAAAGALQSAIWWLEGEGANPGNYYSALVVAQFGTFATASMDQLAVGATDFGVQAVNMYNLDGTRAQDALVFVPDGGATLMLLGGALVGLGALRRKFRV